MNDIFIQMKKDQEKFFSCIDALSTDQRLKHMNQDEKDDFYEMQAE
jgi:hypothetical protein